MNKISNLGCCILQFADLFWVAVHSKKSPNSSTFQ
ncbi:hypothetical protein SLEP1_g24408 [Rubroshorea leprosula]|uniref:Uncharacterized protein n=1 Tax=Rubroshorea leprosula TaxID=152421 RepID=A0AAV5JFW2_9ROSI|nr:hypothetical protein SLEP1_g24408 [Rubroshorea leprosula]